MTNAQSFAEFHDRGHKVTASAGRVASFNRSAGTVRVRDLLFGVELFALDFGTFLDALAFTPDGERIIAIRRYGSSNCIRVVDAASGRALKHWRVRTGVCDHRIAFSSDGSRMFVAATRCSTLFSFDLQRCQQLPAISAPGDIQDIAMSADGAEVVAVCSAEQRGGGACIAVHDASSGAALRRVALLPGAVWPSTRVGFAPDARSFVVQKWLDNSANIAVMRFDVDSGTRVWEHELRDAALAAFAVTLDSAFVTVVTCSHTAPGMANVSYLRAAHGREVARVTVRLGGPRAYIDALDVSSLMLAGRIVAITRSEGYSAACVLFSASSLFYV